MREAQKGHQNATLHHKPLPHRPRPTPANSTANSTQTKTAQPKVKPTLLQNHLDDEYFVEYDDDEYFVDEYDDEYFMDDMYNDDALFAEDDFFIAKKANSTLTATNSTRPVKPIHRPIIGGRNVTSPFPLKPRPTNSTNIPRPLPRPTLRHAPKTNSTKPVAPLKPTRIPVKPIKPIKPTTNTTSNVVAADDEYFVDFDDEYWVDIDDDMLFADELYEDEYMYAEDDEYYGAEDLDDFFVAHKIAKNNATMTATNSTRPVRPIHPIFKPLAKPTNGTIRPRQQPRPIGRPIFKTNSTKPVVPVKPTKPTKPVKPTTNITSNIVAADDEYFVDFDDEYWVDMDDELFYEDELYEDDEYFMNADDDFYAARNRNHTETVKAKKNSTLEHLKEILKDGKKEVKPAVHKIKETAKNVTAQVKDTIKNATKPAAPKKGFLSMF
jgi:hypothetical protein